MFIETPQDIFWIVAAFVVLLLGILLAVAIYYVIVFLKQYTGLARAFREKVEKLSDIAGLVREKLMGPSAWVAGLVAALMQGLKIAKKVRRKKEEE